MASQVSFADGDPLRSLAPRPRRRSTGTVGFRDIVMRSPAIAPRFAWPTSRSATRLRLRTDTVAQTRQPLSEPALPAESLPDTPKPEGYGVARLLDERGELRRFEALEAEVIRFAVNHYRGHMSEVARRLGIGRSTPYRNLKDYRLSSGRERLGRRSARSCA